MSSSARRARNRILSGYQSMNLPKLAQSLIHRPDLAALERPKVALTPMETLSELTAAGWGDTPQCKIPENWREIPGPDKRRKL